VYTPEQLAILQEFLLADANGKLVETRLKRPENRPLGIGPKLASDCIERFLKADPSLRWTRWMLYQAAGGARAKEASERAMEQLRERFIDERVSGFLDNDKTFIHGVIRAEAEALWAKTEPRYRRIIQVADQDAVEKTGAFGFYRNWPGGSRSLYDKTIKAVIRFLKLEDKVKAMNADMLKESKEAIPEKPDDYPDVDALEKTTSKIERYFASKQARDDIRFERILTTDSVTVVAPLTYAASVRYGYADWQFSNPSMFDQLLVNDNAFHDPWKSAVTASVLVYISFSVPMPCWVVRKGENFDRKYLSNLCVQIPRAKLKDFRKDAASMTDEEGRTLTLDEIRRMINAEVARNDDPANEEWPVKRGPRVITTTEQAKEVIQLVENTLLDVEAWARNFDAAKIVNETLKLSL
jgi:hypothetical protein